MKILLVTQQCIDIRNSECYCNRALLGTLENMSILGDIYIVAGKELPDKPVAQPLNTKIDFISPEHIKHLLPTNRRILDYLNNHKYNLQLLDKLIPEMDLVIGYAPSGYTDAALKIASKYNVPFLTFLVGCIWDALHNHQRILARILAPFSMLSTRRTVKNSDYVHYVTRDFLQSRYPTKGKSLGCSDTNLGNIDPSALKNRLQTINTHSSNTIIKLITTAAIDVKYKGQEYVIKAISKLKEKGDLRYHYYLIGGGNDLYLRKLSQKLGVENQIHFEGRKTAEEVITLLKEADIYIQPSLQEGLPRSVVEAMSVAMPCIGFKTGGIPELLEAEFVVKQKSVNGIIKCLKSLQNTNKYKETAEYNFKKACEYEHDKLVIKIRSFFKEIRQEIETNK